jgi:hypothetical protein
MAALTTRSVGYAGTATLSAASTSDTAEVGLHKFLLYENTGTQKTITITTGSTATPYTEATSSTVTYTLAATTGRLWIPLHSDYETSGGRTTVTMSPDATGVSVAVVATDWVE